MKLERQIELQLSELHVREAEGGERSRTIEGYAVVFGVRSVNLTPWSSKREVYEIMERGCIDQELLNRSDVVLTAFHDNTAILGRSRNGMGTLEMQLDARGLKVRCTLANTERANELLSAIERGDISGMSFAFTADEEDNVKGVAYERTDEKTADGKTVWLRRVRKVTGLYDVTIAGHPAYEQTTIEAREIDEKLRACGGEEDDKRGCGDDKDEQKRNDDPDEKDDIKDDDPDGKDNSEEQDERELEEQAQRFREQQALRLRYKARIINDEIIESFSY